MRDHLKATLRWSNKGKIETAEVLAASLGMAAPVALGFWTGQPSAGFVAALGALIVGRVEPGARLPIHARREAEALGPAICAMLVVTACGWFAAFRDLALLAPIALVAVAGGYSRPLATAATRFVLFAAIMSAIPAAGAKDSLGVLALTLLGAFWTSALSFIFGSGARRKLPRQQAPPPQEPATARQKYQRWTRSLRTLSGWSYAARLVAAMGLGAVANHLWPDHHLHWIGLTAAILTTREPEIVSVRATQRALGTAVGVAATGTVLRSAIAIPALVIAIGLLAGLRAYLRPANYLAYSMVMTPLIILIIDRGDLPAAGLLIDRLLATVVGVASVMAAGAVMKLLLRFRSAAEDSQNST